jgi:hypothetical protein
MLLVVEKIQVEGWVEIAHGVLDWSHLACT